MTNPKPRDCLDCAHCCSVHGFMATCRYWYSDGYTVTYVGQDVNRKKAQKCDHYTTLGDANDVFPSYSI